jgi:hypothetical protein
VQVAGRLRGGVEVTIRGRQHTVDARGHLDLRNQNLGPAEVKEVAAFLATSAGGAVSSLCCANNPGMVGDLDDSGRLKTPDVHAEVFKQLTDSLKISKVTEADFSSCGIGPVALGHLSDWVRDAIGAVNSMTVDGNDIFGTKRYNYKAKHKYLDMSGWKAMCEAMKTSSTITSFSAADVDMNPEAADRRSYRGERRIQPDRIRWRDCLARRTEDVQPEVSRHRHDVHVERRHCNHWLAVDDRGHLISRRSPG